MLGRVGLRGAASLVEVLPHLDDGRPERAHPLDLAAVGVARGEDDRRHAQRAGGVGDALAEVPGRRPRRSARSGPILPSPARAWTTTQVPRPLNERIGLTVSTLTMTGHPEAPRQALVDVLRRVREGGIDPLVGGADRLDGQFGDRDQRGRRSRRDGWRDRPQTQKRPKEPRSTVAPANASTGKTASGSGPLRARTTLPGATGRREGTYPRVSRFVVASCEGCPHASTKRRQRGGSRWVTRIRARAASVELSGRLAVRQDRRRRRRRSRTAARRRCASAVADEALDADRRDRVDRRRSPAGRRRPGSHSRPR